MSAPSPAAPSSAAPSSAKGTRPHGRAVRLFRWCALAEACSWLGLLVGMFFKYVVVGDDLGVNVFGPVHGALFVAYLVAAVAAGRALRWDARTFLLALAASVPPLGTLWFERWARRSGRLGGPGRQVPSPRLR